MREPYVELLRDQVKCGVALVSYHSFLRISTIAADTQALVEMVLSRLAPAGVEARCARWEGMKRNAMPGMLDRRQASDPSGLRKGYCWFLCGDCGKQFNELGVEGADPHSDVIALVVLCATR